MPKLYSSMSTGIASFPRRSDKVDLCEIKYLGSSLIDFQTNVLGSHFSNQDLRLGPVVKKLKQL